MHLLIDILGVAALSILIAAAVVYVLAHVWVWLSIGIAYWWANIQSDPRHNSVRPEYKKQWMWKVRLLVLILSRPQRLINMQGCQVSNKGWRLDCRRTVPVVHQKPYGKLIMSYPR